ncbi:MAG: hypothetical protein LJE69_01245 [Thiohalocapsa sp.]|uniref:hypothetical protein n=1 Tax=Thiohalocapsa sp. TaxID=2497641 RepID=UPI0025DD2769|nr:hypothetical protein [Thiohalocapsa sp.]MCG6939861.1 hypothetical protein [Thiohalocapsa sp.]
MTHTRRLILFPIVHTPEDLGGLASAVAQARPTAMDRQRHNQALAEVWGRIEQAAAALPVMTTGWRVYQDGLPVCGQEAAIVDDLAASGSRNHRLVKRLVNRGAALMGTESAELLVEEYQLQKQLLEQVGEDASGIAEETRRLAAEILLRRDHFIAQRIDQTLAPGETGILFLGLVHDLESHLAADIQVEYPAGRAQRTGV